MKWSENRRNCFLVIGVVLLAGCTTTPSPPIDVREAKTSLTAITAKHKDLATTFMHEGRLAESALQWEILTLLEPDNRNFKRQLEETRSRVRNAATEQLSVAEKALRQGDTEQASQAYLKTLALEPFNQTAAQGLRTIEQEKTKSAMVTRPPRATTPSAAAPPAKPALTPGANEQRELDLGVMLYRQEDYAGSILVLDKFLKKYPADSQVRQYLAESHVQHGRQLVQRGEKEAALASFEKAQNLNASLPPELGDELNALKKSVSEDYYQQGLRIYQTDIPQAMQYWLKSLQYDPNHVQAGLRLEQARQMLQKLKTIR